MPKTNKNKFFGSLHKAILPSGKAKAGKRATRKSCGCSEKRTRQGKTGGASEKRSDVSHQENALVVRKILR